MTFQKTSLLVNKQVPEFVREEYPLFITFLEAYYRFLETQQGVQLNDLTTKAKDLREIFDVDSSIDSFEEHFFNTFAEFVPRDVEVSKEFLIKNVLPLYLSKGNEEAFKLLFRLLFNDEVTITLPKNNIIRASDGKWSVDNVLKIDTNVRSVYVGDGTNTTFFLAQVTDIDQIEVYVDDVLQEILVDYNVRRETRKLIFNSAPSNNSEIKVFYLNFDVAKLNNRKITGLTSGATALVERAVPRIITDRLNFGLPFELFINSKTLTSNFLNGEEIETNIIDEEENLIRLTADTFSILTKINVVDGGSSYNIGDPVTILGGGADVGATAEVESVTDGFSTGIVTIYGGAGFKVASLVESTSIPGGTIITGAVDAVNTSNPSTANTFLITDDVISSYENVTIDSGDYGFPGLFTENVNTRISDALTPLVITDLGPITNVTILFSNTSINTTALDSQGAIYQAGNNFFDIKSFHSIGRIDVSVSGNNYVVGDEVIFGANPFYTFGYGVAAAVKTVNNSTGAVETIEIQPPRITGTANIQNNSVIVTGTNTLFEEELKIGDKIVIRSQERFVNAITSNTSVNVNSSFTFTASKEWANDSPIGSFSKGLIGGTNYVQNNFPTVTISSNTGTNAVIEITSLIGDGEILQAFSNTPAGVIQSIDLTSGGVGYQYIPEIDLSGAGDGTAVGVAEIGSSYISFAGRWLTSDSIISSSERRIQGNDYYIEYSYVTNSLTEFSRYKDVLKRLLHPAGFVNYATLNRETSIDFDNSVIETSTENTISGFVSVNSSVFIDGSNTRFNLANQLSIMTIGSNVAVNGEIRTIDSFISNTNVKVTSAFTTNSSSQTLIILT
jgi:hypothetical protein